MLALKLFTQNKAFSALTLSSILLLSACGDQEKGSPKNMQQPNQTISLTGAGASFPAPVYIKWADQHFQTTKNKINYQSIGSSAGIKQIIARTVDFGTSDAPVKEEELEREGLFQFPTIIGGVVLAINVEGIQSNEMILDGKTLAAIFMGKITKWNDPTIKSLNPNLTLPDQNISVVRRADGSGTSFVFTNYLAKASPEWQNKIGSGSTVSWPVGVGGKGNDGVTAFVQRLSGSIGYVEYAYAKQNNLPYTKLVSADGEIVSPSKESFSAAAVDADWEKSFAQDLTNQKGSNAWPITSTTFVILHKKQKEVGKAKEILNFFDWGYTAEGEKIATDLDYAPLPKNVIEIIHKAWTTEILTEDGQTIFQPTAQ